MSPEQRLRKTFELNELGRELFRQGLRRRHPELSPSELKALERKRLEKCHNRSY
jgi:DNA-binding PadR family transcriptional regulator